MESNVRTSVLKVLAYFDLFNYPLSKEEIYLFLDRKVEGYELKTALARLVADQNIFRFNEFYSVKNDPSLLKKRLSENAHAQTLLLKANSISKFLFRFPYIKGIGISGSLSKNVADEQSDIDYFILAAPNRLWIARTIMHLFKKFTFLTGHQHWYCMNYYVDEAEMQIKEKNIFTATELMTLLPVCGNGTMRNFFKANDWANVYFPNYKQQEANTAVKSSHTGLSKVIEFLFNNRMGDLLDNYLMNVTKKRWKQKEEKFKLNIKGGRMGLDVSKHCCKPNPAFFHADILAKYASKLIEVERQLHKSHTDGRYQTLAQREA